MIVQHCDRFVHNIQQYANMFDEEQEKELEAEKEQDVILYRPPAVKSHPPTLSTSLVQLLKTGDFSHPNYTANIMPITLELSKTSFQKRIQPDGWSKDLYCTADFATVVASDGAKSNRNFDNYLRPVRYLAIVNDKIIVMSGFEANALIHRFGEFAAKLHMYAPRTRPNQSVLFDKPALVVPPQTNPSIIDSNHPLMTQLSVYAGNLYYNTNEEQEEVCRFLGLCLAPRTPSQQDAFDHREFSTTGFVGTNNRYLYGQGRCEFEEDPVGCLTDYIPFRTHFQNLNVSHLGVILTRARKINVESDGEEEYETFLDSADPDEEDEIINESDGEQQEFGGNDDHHGDDDDDDDDDDGDMNGERIGGVGGDDGGDDLMSDDQPVSDQPLQQEDDQQMDGDHKDDDHENNEVDDKKNIKLEQGATDLRNFEAETNRRFEQQDRAFEDLRNDIKRQNEELARNLESKMTSLMTAMMTQLTQQTQSLIQSSQPQRTQEQLSPTELSSNTPLRPRKKVSAASTSASASKKRVSSAPSSSTSTPPSKKRKEPEAIEIIDDDDDDLEPVPKKKK
ncbi:replicase polyprotein [Acrasis kona]|uniref:Replicase polyprotein n=1 Tax=Acrasis kona TaxID=1008807 RepID=A0AAW2Z0R9_9EUKA